MNTPVEILEQQVKLLKETIEIQNKLIDVLRGSQVQNIFQGQWNTVPNIIYNQGPLTGELDIGNSGYGIIAK